MSDMMKQFVRETLDDTLKNEYPHMRYPPCVCAHVVNAKKSGDDYICTIRILDKNMQTDNQFPEIPAVQTSVPVHQGNRVVVLMLYGECNPYIVGRC